MYHKGIHVSREMNLRWEGKSGLIYRKKGSTGGREEESVSRIITPKRKNEVSVDALVH